MEEDVTKDLAEFSIANAVYAALVEGHAAEISSKYVAVKLRALDDTNDHLDRRNAMDNASKVRICCFS